MNGSVARLLRAGLRGRGKKVYTALKKDWVNTPKDKRKRTPTYSIKGATHD